MIIKSARFIISNTDINKCPTDDKSEYAFIGRSNVGKSSLINMLTSQKKLAMTSATPGKTTLINHFLINEEWYLVDLPGYGYAKRSDKERNKIKEIINKYILERNQMANLFLLIDIRLEPQKIDLDFIEWLGSNNIPFSIVFTKSDKLNNSKKKINVNIFVDKLKENWEELPPYFVTSAETGLGRTEILDYIEKINKNKI